MATFLRGHGWFFRHRLLLSPFSLALSEHNYQSVSLSHHWTKEGEHSKKILSRYASSPRATMDRYKDVTMYLTRYMYMDSRSVSLPICLFFSRYAPQDAYHAYSTMGQSRSLARSRSFSHHPQSQSTSQPRWSYAPSSFCLQHNKTTTKEEVADEGSHEFCINRVKEKEPRHFIHGLWCTPAACLSRYGCLLLRQQKELPKK